MSKTKEFSVGMPFSERLKIALDGMSHNELARRTGIPQQTISKYVAGRDPKLSYVERIEAVLPQQRELRCKELSHVK